MFDAIWDGFRPLLPVLVMVAFIGILVVIVLAYIKRTPKAAGQDFSSYTPATFLLSKAEYSFYQILCLIAGEKYCVYPKVRLADIVTVKGGKNYHTAFNRVKSKHIDFLICDKSSKIVFAVELDDKAHLQQKVKKADTFKDDLFKAIGIRCIRYQAQSSYNVEDVKRKLIPQKAPSGEIPQAGTALNAREL
jgi:hypothetical protein